jgi:hypothetical protein
MYRWHRRPRHLPQRCRRRRSGCRGRHVHPNLQGHTERFPCGKPCTGTPGTATITFNAFMHAGPEDNRCP